MLSSTRKALLIMFPVIAAILLILAILVLLSPGKPYPVVDASGRPVPGALSEKLRVPIDGVEHG